jgi:hypothetical protein
VDALEVERRVFHRIRKDVESDVIVGLRGWLVSQLGPQRHRGTHQSKPGENEVKHLIEHLDVDPKLAHKAVGGPVDVVKVKDTMYGSKERAVEPASTLRDQLWHLKDLD